MEAGLRSFDRSMPEEINRVPTDQVSSLLFTHSPEARGHLLREGCPEETIHAVGNTMIDTLEALRERLEPEATAAAHGQRLEATSWSRCTGQHSSMVPCSRRRWTNWWR